MYVPCLPKLATPPCHSASRSWTATSFDELAELCFLLQSSLARWPTIKDKLDSAPWMA